MGINFKNLFIKDKIDDPPYSYDLLASLPEEKYPVYLKKFFKWVTGQNLNLSHPKTFNEKIQWLKLYDVTPLKTQLTDKVLVRDWIKEKIGEEYLKPVLWIGKNFDEIPFDKLPDTFLIKVNHGCKWQYKIKNKDKFLNTPQLYNYVKTRFGEWLHKEYYLMSAWEMHYKGIEPQIIIEPVLLAQEDEFPPEYEILCFNGTPKIYQKIKYSVPTVVSVYEEDFSESKFKYNPRCIIEYEEPSENLKKAVELSKILCENFKLVRVDWLEYNGKIFFNEMTFSPYSGFLKFDDEKDNLRLGNMLNLKK